MDLHGGLAQTWVSITWSIFWAEVIIIYICSVIQRATLALLLTVSLKFRLTIHVMASELDIPKTNLQIMIRGGKLRANSITVKPKQIEDNTGQRIYFCVNYININRQIFEDMMILKYRHTDMKLKLTTNLNWSGSSYFEIPQKKF